MINNKNMMSLPQVLTPSMDIIIQSPVVINLDDDYDGMLKLMKKCMLS
jgi:hypothetical protein